MILQALTQYYEDLVKQDKIARPGWAMQKVSYALCIGESGELEQVVPLLEETEGKKPQPQRLSLPAPVKRTAGIAPNFLWDNSSYLLGMDAKGKPERSIKCFEACRDYHHALLDGVESAAAKSILRFFDSWVPKNTNTHPALLSDIDAIMAGSNLVFRVNGSYAHEDELIQKAWQNSYDRTEGELQQCLVTGQKDLIEAVHPSIKGVDGAQSSGAAIVSFNAPAFCSYGQEQNYNAPVGKYAAFAYTSALNHLLADRENVQKIGDTTVVCWAGPCDIRDSVYIDNRTDRSGFSGSLRCGKRGGASFQRIMGSAGAGRHRTVPEYPGYGKLGCSDHRNDCGPVL